MLRKLKADKRERGIAVSDDEEEEAKKPSNVRGFEPFSAGVQVVETLYTEVR